MQPTDSTTAMHGRLCLRSISDGRSLWFCHKPAIDGGQRCAEHTPAPAAQPVSLVKPVVAELTVVEPPSEPVASVPHRLPYPLTEPRFLALQFLASVESGDACEIGRAMCGSRDNRLLTSVGVQMGVRLAKLSLAREISHRVFKITSAGLGALNSVEERQ